MPKHGKVRILNRHLWIANMAVTQERTPASNTEPETAIAPVDAGIARPPISVMIPTYEPTLHLTATLHSVLQQDPGPDQMQIAVVDDGSRNVDVAALVTRIAPPDRVEIHREPYNRGLAGNWNRCIALARGQVVHLLHQDDWLNDGFYRRVLPAFTKRANVGMAFCRYSITDAAGNVTRRSHRERWRAGTLPDWLTAISERQRIQCAAVLVRRSVYEQLGGYRPDLCYALDWEMWVRIAARCDVWYEPKMLAYYRQHQGNESSRLQQNNATAWDVLKAIDIFAESLPQTQRRSLVSHAYASFAKRVLKQAIAAEPKTPSRIHTLLKPIEAAIARITHSPRLARLYLKQAKQLKEWAQ